MTTPRLPGLEVPALPGSYVLVLRAGHPCTLVVGQLGTLRVTPGWYLYVGSALGAGGLRGRLRHHRVPAARPHWHIDYLRAAVELVEILWLESPQRLEHQWAGRLATLPGCCVPLPRFGASDCHCAAHLFQVPEHPSFDMLSNLLCEQALDACSLDGAFVHLPLPCVGP